MPDVTVNFTNGTKGIYKGVPDTVSDIDIAERVRDEHPDLAIGSIEGAREAGLGERMKGFLTSGQAHIFQKDLPQLLYGLGDVVGAKNMPPAQGQDEKESRSAGQELPLALGRALPTKAGGTSFLKPPNFSGGSWYQQAVEAAKAAKGAQTAPQAAQTLAQTVASSPMMSMVAKAAGFGSGIELMRFIVSHL